MEKNRISLEGTSTLVLENGRKLRLAYGRGSTFRLQSLPGGAPSGKDFQNPRKAYFTAVAFAWAMLPPATWSEFQSPEQFAELVPVESLDVLVTAIVGAFDESDIGKEETPKNSSSGKSRGSKSTSASRGSASSN